MAASAPHRLMDHLLGRGISLVRKVEKLNGVAGPDLVFLRLRNIGVDFVDDRPGIGPLVLDMWEIGREHDTVDADMLAFFDRHPLVLYAEIDVLAHVMAREFL